MSARKCREYGLRVVDPYPPYPREWARTLFILEPLDDSPELGSGAADEDHNHDRRTEGNR